MGLIFWVIIGGLAGWAASKIMKGQGQGLLMNIVIGVIGAVIGGALLWLVGFRGTGIIASFLTALLGAVVLLYGVDYLQKRRKT